MWSFTKVANTVLVGLIFVLPLHGVYGEEVPGPLKEILKMKGNKKGGPKDGLTGIRRKALRETAQALAGQRAYRWRYEQIQTHLHQIAPRLDDIYVFRPFLLYQGNLLPPVVVLAGPAHRLESEILSVRADRTFKIERAGRLLTAVPDWRSYLLREYPVQEKFHPGLFPRSKVERKVWETAVTEAWGAGVGHAEYEFLQGLRRLTRDLRGVILYRILLLQGQISPTRVSEGFDAVDISEERRKLQVGRTVTRVVERAEFTEPGFWAPRLFPLLPAPAPLTGGGVR